MAHVQHWQNTIVGQRRYRLKDRAYRLLDEEAERVRVDDEHARDEQERRRAFIQRAKNLVFYEQDKVKKIHSNILLDLVLEVLPYAFPVGGGREGGGRGWKMSVGTP